MQSMLFAKEEKIIENAQKFLQNNAENSFAVVVVCTFSTFVLLILKGHRYILCWHRICHQ